MTSTSWIAAVSTVFVLGLAGFCPAQAPDKITPDVAALVKGNNTFAIDLYGHVCHEDGNLFFSPYTISDALAMTYAGARGKTADDMAATLKFPFQGERLNAAFAGLIQELNKKDMDRKSQLTIANALWGQKGYGFLPAFIKLTKDAYGASLQELDFTKAEEARKVVNNWVAQQTQDKIKDLLPPGTINDATKLVLTNAIYFKANWQDAFPAAATNKEDFKSGGKKAKVDMMHVTTFYKFMQNDDMQMLELPYLQNELSMLVLLPRKDDGLAGLEKQLTAANLENWRGELKKHQVNIAFPKFTFTSSLGLKKVLSDMGMAVAFSGQADFSGMTSRERLCIDAVIHKAFVAVDEKGTEAAAATAVTMMPTAIQEAPMATFRSDHPFLFLIREHKTGEILFMGRVTQP
jgi:serine protease inhibitor